MATPGPRIKRRKPYLNADEPYEWTSVLFSEGFRAVMNVRPKEEKQTWKSAQLTKMTILGIEYLSEHVDGKVREPESSEDLVVHMGDKVSGPESSEDLGEHVDDEVLGPGLAEELLTLCFEEFGERTLPHSTTTKAGAIAMIMAYAVSERSTWSGLDKLLKLVNDLFGCAVVPPSAYMLRKLWAKTKDNLVKYHYLCPSCGTVLKAGHTLASCDVCQFEEKTKNLRQDGSFFLMQQKPTLFILILRKLSIPFRTNDYFLNFLSSIFILQSSKQLKQLIEKTSVDLYNSLLKLESSNSDLITDITTGAAYKTLRQKVALGCVRYVADEAPAPRTSGLMARDMVLAQRLGDPVNGVKGPSALMNLKGFDLVEGMSAEYMHSVLQGVVRQFTELLFSSSSSRQAYYMAPPLPPPPENFLAAPPPSPLGKMESQRRCSRDSSLSGKTSFLSMHCFSKCEKAPMSSSFLHSVRL
ncbi:hypothetical protein HPB47_011984 [Ixodes persulcatus]|uniref:Uncharacterized protein n=1 Tax=Ixodes persulcatus TaxID=34615 RepID=A0AC60NUU9_IXOPE|nr:hypothetical protein HPB47_011984 [Ixodes persulcatus]